MLQEAKCFLLILLGTTLFCETGHKVSIALLGPLQDLSRVATFDWGFATLAYLYYRFDIVRRGAVTICGFWHVLCVCFSIPFNFLLFRYGVSRSDSSEALVLLALT